MTAPALAVGLELPALQIEPISRRTLALFAGASGDHQPVHIDLDAARARGLEDVFAHGMLSMAYLGRLLTDWVPQGRIRSLKVRFVAVTPIHAQPLCQARVRAVDDSIATIDLVITLTDGTTTARGEALVDIG
jgi:acyl dehydratase